MSKYYVHLIVFFLLGNQIFSQEKKQSVKDSIKTYKLDEVVISTGQYKPQSIKKAVYDVSVIKNNKIVNLAANSLEDVLQQSLNLKVTPSLRTGKTTVSLFGLDGQYVKVLVDNIPIVNDEGYGNNIDLSQINLQDVKQIEIVEGAMAVEYGANAVAGVINIVTNKKSLEKLKISASIMEETVGKEFGFFDKGKHIQSFSAKYNFNDNLFSSVSANHNMFKGYFNNRKGRYYRGTENLRGHHWLPKEQYNINALLNYRNNGWEAFYKISFMSNEVDNYNKSFERNYNPTTGTEKPFAFDKQFNTQRFNHILNINKRLSETSKLNVNFAYQSQELKENSYTFYLKSHTKKDEKDRTISKMSALTSIGSYSFEKLSNKLLTKLGYDIGFKKALMSNLAYTDIDKSTKDKKMNHYDLYGFTEYKYNPKISLRIGSRIMMSELFSTKLAYSISGKYAHNGWEVRSVFGSSPRNPNFEELYYIFVDPNHNVVGNEDLKAENAISINLNIKKKFLIGNTYNAIKLKSQYIDVHDRITWVSKKLKDQRNVFTPINTDKYTAWSFSASNSLRYDNLEFNIGAMYQGTKRSQKGVNMGENYLYYWQLNSGIVYKTPIQNIVFSSYYKYNGSESRYIYNSQNKLTLTQQDPYHMLDASLNKSFFKKLLNVTIGTRNITNTTQIQSFQESTQGHETPSSSREFSYGRSYYTKLTINF